MHRVIAVLISLCLFWLPAVTAIPIDLPCKDCLSGTEIGHSNATSNVFPYTGSLTSAWSGSFPNPAYSVFNIPNSPLSLELTVGNPLRPEAIRICLDSAAVWVNGQTQSASMSWPDFDWKDIAGAELYIVPARTPLIWQNVADVVRGLKLYELGSHTHRGVQMEASFDIIIDATGQLIGQGYLVRYEHAPAPPSVDTSLQ
ncbi:MAG: hypothetical protein Q9163_000068 [Psora crenata]